MKVQFKHNGYCEYDKNVKAYAKNGLRVSLKSKFSIHFLLICC